MIDGQEANQPGMSVLKDREDPEAILNNLRIKVPSFHDVEEQRLKNAIRPKIDNLLRGYGGQQSESRVGDLLVRIIAMGCSSFKIDPDELIILSGQLKQHQVAAAEVTSMGEFALKKLIISPVEVAFRDELVTHSGIGAAKALTDLVFVAPHEMTHLGQAIYAEDEYRNSRKFSYPDRPTEKHADEVGLAFCRELLATTQVKGKADEIDKILLCGLPETIKEASENQRPLL